MPIKSPSSVSPSLPIAPVRTPGPQPRRRLARVRLGVALGAVLTAGLAPAPGHTEELGGLLDPSASWQTHKKKDGIQLEKRKMPGSSFLAYRALAHLPVRPEAAADFIWRNILEAKNPILKKRDVLRRADSEILLYDKDRKPRSDGENPGKPFREGVRNEF